MRLRPVLVAVVAVLVMAVSGCSAVQQQVQEIDAWNTWVDQANATMTELNTSTALDKALASGDRKATAKELRVMAEKYTSIANGPDAELNQCFLKMASLSEELAVTVETKKDPTTWVEGATKLDAQQATCNARVDVLNAQHGAQAPS